MRDEFPAGVKNMLAKRVGDRCSNPACRQLTSGPTTETVGTVNLGVAAHITSAAAGGPRYESSLSVDVRRSPENGIWLCQKCAKLVDSDVHRYSTKVLRLWKRLAEEVARTELETRSGAVAALGTNTGLQTMTLPRPWVTIDDYTSRFVDDEQTGEAVLWETVHIINRGQAPAVSIVVPEIHFGGRTARLLRPLPTLGPGEGIHAELLNLEETLKRALRDAPKPPGGPKCLRLPLVIEYRDLDHRRWVTELTLVFSVLGISFEIAHPDKPQRRTDVSVLGSNQASQPEENPNDLMHEPESY
jgi:hypothetical protein